MASIDSDYSDLSDNNDDIPRGENDTSEESTNDDSDSSEDESDHQSGDDDDDPAVESTHEGFWMSMIGEDGGPTSIPFTSTSGPQHAIAADSQPIDYVLLYYDSHLVDFIVHETNRYADQWVRNHQMYLKNKPRSLVHTWIKYGHTTRKEMYAFLAIVINIGLVRKVTLESYFDTVHPSQYTPWFAEHFSRDRFSLILKFLHFENNGTVPQDPSHNGIHKIQKFIDILIRKFQFYYKPHKDISIDESMVGYKGKTPHLRVYMPNKHHARYGVKLWCLCDSKSAYTYTFEVFKGSHEVLDKTGEGVTYNLVMRLLGEAGLLFQGYHLGLDNYFSSPRLFFDLFSKQTTATGTVRQNRKGLPKQVLKAKLKIKQVCERRKGNLLCVAYKDSSKTPILISTQASGGYEMSRNSKSRERRVPKVVKLYNQSMGGVDLSDARLYAYLAEGRTMKWTTKVAFALLGRALLNAYILYEENTSDRPKLTRYQFNVSVVESMMGDFRPPQKIVRKRRSKTEIEAARQQPQDILPPELDVQPGPSACKLHKLQKGKRRNCAHQHTTRVRSSFECPSCNVGLCPGCFSGYHQM